MTTTMTIKGQVTIRKQFHDALGLKPGARLDFAVNRDGEIVLQRANAQPQRKQDRFEAARGTADIKWRTQDLMTLLRDKA